MGVQATSAVIDRYFELMGRGDDFSVCCTSDVTWTTVDDGTQVRGRGPVRDYVNALHATMVDISTRDIALAEDAAYLEGDYAASAGRDAHRVGFCIAYDVSEHEITAMRCYGAVPHLAPEPSP